jgi:type VI secretion system VasD/TssJ family lipoprotein
VSRARHAVPSLAAAAAAVAALCAAPAVAADETKLRSEVVAAGNINPSRRGAPQPVQIHIFYLANDEAFRQANLSDLLNPQAAALGDDLVRRAEHMVGPGERLELDETFDEAAKYIGVVANFSEPEQASWRALEAVPGRRWTDVLRLFKDNKLQISVDGLTVSCEIVKD